MISTHSEELQVLVRDAARELEIPGAQLALLQEGELWSFSTGMANVATRVPVTDDTLFQVGSVTKLYTAALVMQLADRGLVDLDAPVRRYLPTLRVGDEETVERVTSRHLLTMSSGLDNGPYLDTGRGDDAVLRYVDALAGIPPVFPPGDGFGYSNASTCVAGRLVESLTGRCWDDTLVEQLLTPGGFAESGSLPEEVIYHRVAVGHDADEHGRWTIRKPWRYSRGTSPAGSCFAASAADLVRFGAVFLNAGRTVSGARLLSEDAVREMQRPQVDVPTKLVADSWCVGSHCQVWGRLAVHGHGGTTVNGSAQLLWIPDRNTAVALTVNRPNRGYAFAERVLAAVCSRIAGVEKPGPPEPSSAFVPGDPYVGTYERYGVRTTVQVEDRALVLTENEVADSDLPGYQSEENDGPIRTTLRPLGAHRFLPADDALTGHRKHDVAFVLDEGGRAQRLLVGAFAARRTDGGGAD